MSQLTLPGVLPWMPETIEEATTAYNKKPEYWSQIGVDFFSIIKIINSAYKTNQTQDSSIDTLKLRNYLNILTTADRMIKTTTSSISLLSDNSQDGFLELLFRNIEQNPKKYHCVRTRVISLDTDPQTGEQLRHFASADLLDSIIAKTLSPEGVRPYLVCSTLSDYYSLKINTPSHQLRDKSLLDSEAELYAGYFARSRQRIFDLEWDTLLGTERPKPKKKRFFWLF